MCYMEERMKVGVRELRQNLSVYLRRVKQGETLEVTERGLPVALLAPLKPETSTIERWIAEGKIRPAQGDPRELTPPARASVSFDELMEALMEQRRDRF